MCVLHARRLPALCAALALVWARGCPVSAAAAGTPILHRVFPSGVAPGGTLTIDGQNFGTAGGQVDFFGPGVSAPAVAGQILLWQSNVIRVQVPANDLWPGLADVEVITPALGNLPSNALPVVIDSGASSVAAPQAVWLPSANGGTGSLRVGWNDSNGVSPAPIELNLPTAAPGGGAAFTVPAAIPAVDVTVNGEPAVGVTVTPTTVPWPGIGSSAGATLRITPAVGSAPVPGELVVAIAPAAGVQAPSASETLPLIVGPGDATAAVEVEVGAPGVAAYRVTAPAQVPAGSAFTVSVQAVSPSGTPVPDANGPVYLSSGGDVDFLSAQPTGTGPSTARITLRSGAGRVTAVAQLPGPVTVRATDAAGLDGSATVDIAPPPTGSGVHLQVFPSFSGYQGSATDYTAASVRSLDRHSGAFGAAGGTTLIYGGFWPSGVGVGYDARWTGTITVRAPAPLPSPLPQPTLRFAFLNEAAQSGAASLTPVAGSGATVNGQVAGVDLATASPAAGWAVPTEVTLTPGLYTLMVQASENTPTADAGDTLYYSEAFTPPAQSPPASAEIGGTAPAPEWSPFSPVPPAAFTPLGLPDPGLSIPIGSTTVDDGGVPVHLTQPALIKGGSALLPLRTLAETLGAEVQWQPETKGITVSGPGGVPPVVALSIGSSAASVNGTPATLVQAPLLLPSGVTMIPLRFLGQALGWQVGWDNTTRTAVLLPPLLPTLPLQP